MGRVAPSAGAGTGETVTSKAPVQESVTATSGRQLRIGVDAGMVFTDQTQVSGNIPAKHIELSQHFGGNLETRGNAVRRHVAVI